MSTRCAQKLENYTQIPSRHFVWALCGRGRVLALQRHRIHVLCVEDKGVVQVVCLSQQLYRAYAVTRLWVLTH